MQFSILVGDVQLLNKNMSISSIKSTIFGWITWLRYQVVVGLCVILLAACMPVSVNTQAGSYPPLIKAAELGDIVLAEKLVKEGEFIGQTTIGNQTALHLAAKAGQDEMVMWLLARNANPFAEDQNGRTPADGASRQGHITTEKLLRDNMQLRLDEIQAVQNGNIEEARQLLLKDTRKETILHFAAERGNIELARQEIQAGVDVNVKTVTGATPLDRASAMGNIELAKVLVGFGSDVNAGDMYNLTALHYAVNGEHKDMVEYLLSVGADPSIRSTLGNQNVLELAETRGNDEIIELLLGWMKSP